MDGAYDRAAYDRQIARIAQKATQIEADLAELRTEAADQEVNTKKRARSLLERWREKTRGTFTFEVRGAVAEAFVDCVMITPREGAQPPRARDLHLRRGSSAGL